MFKAVEEVARLVRKHRGVQNDFFLNIARGGERLLDCIGKAFDKGIKVVPLDDVLKFFCWNLDCNTLFEHNVWVLNQNIIALNKGVAITTHSLSLTLKGVLPVEVFLDASMWDHWPNRWSRNCALVLQSTVPARVRSVSHCAIPRSAVLVSRGIGTDTDRRVGIRAYATGYPWHRHNYCIITSGAWSWGLASRSIGGSGGICP